MSRAVCSAARAAERERPILILTPDLRRNVGGVANYYNALRLHELTRVEYFYVSRNAPETSAGRTARLAASYLRFGWKLLTRDYAAVHANPTMDPKSFLRDGLFLLLARLRGRRRLIFFRGWDPAFATRVRERAVLRAFFRAAYGRTARYVVLGRRFEAELRALGVRDAPVWIETTVADCRPGRPRSRPPPHRGEVMVALFMSRLLIAKGARIAVDAVRLYNETKPEGMPPLQLWLAGSGADAATLERLVRSEHLAFVRFLGHVTGEEKWRALERADLCLFPTCHTEGLPNTVLEAMMHGLPVLTRPEGALGEVVTDGVNGFVIESREPADFARVLQALIADESALSRIAARNREDARRFARDEVARRLIEIYRGIRAG